MDIVVSLIRKCKNNDKKAFHDLLLRYENQLYKICYGYTRSKEASLDVMQEVYIKVFRSINTFNEYRLFYPWVKKITINTCLNYIRDQKKNNMISLDINDGTNGPLIDTIVDRSNSVEETACTNDMQVHLEDSIRNLPDTYRMVLTLRYVEDMTYDQIAASLGQSLGTVKSNISRARKILKKTLEEHNPLEV